MVPSISSSSPATLVELGFLSNESDLENLSINFYDDDNEGIESKKLEQLERIASALERIADMMEKR